MSALKVVFRVDASLQIGSGHVMRCLTLATALKAAGLECHFICREHPGNLLDLIRDKGFKAYSLSLSDCAAGNDSQHSQTAQAIHAHWLGTSQYKDAKDCVPILEVLKPDWLIVDHYALDAEWEISLQAYFIHLMVIDDLADRKHVCNLLLDQNLGREEQDYKGLVPVECQLLIGTQYALLRPEFARLRARSLERRCSPELQNILITMGGVDQHNATGAVLDALALCSLPVNCRINVVMGLNAPWIIDVKKFAASMPWPTEVLVNITDMAERMAAADIVIGAAGSTSWERCCLGVPTVLVVLAENQKSGASALLRSGSITLIGNVQEIPLNLPSALSNLWHGNALLEMSQCAREVSDGCGVQRVIERILF